MKQFGWEASDFKYWKVRELFNNRGQCRIIHIHWPEAFWRKSSKPLVITFAAFFIIIFYLGRLLKYKWVWTAHNVIPHNSVTLPRLELIMRKFIISNFDAVIGMAHNAKSDLIKTFGNSGKQYVEAIHGNYEDYYPVELSRDQFLAQLNIPDGVRIFLVMNTIPRDNRGVEEIVDMWCKYNPEDYLLIAGNKPGNFKSNGNCSKIIFYNGKIANDLIGSFFTYSDYLILNYKHITTSGLFFLALTFELPVIAPDLPFFCMHSSKNTAILYRSNRTIFDEWPRIIKQINSNRKNIDNDFIQYKDLYSFKSAAKHTAELYKELIHNN